MKFTKLISLVMVATTISVGLPLSQPMTVQAKRRPKTTLTTFPKALRGTWYERQGRQAGKPYYHMIQFTKKRAGFKLDVSTNLVKVNLHAHRYPFHGSRTTRHQWIYATKAHGGTNVQYWNSTVTLPMAGYWRTRTKKDHGHKIKTLEQFNPKTGKKMGWSYYSSKKIANRHPYKF